MKRNIFSFAFLLMLFIATFSCQSSKEVAQKSIDENTTAFFAALEKQDFEAAKKLATPATQKLLTVVMEDAKKYKEFNDKPKPIKIEIVDRKVEDTVADYKVRIIIGEKIKEETIHCVNVNNVWLLDMPEEHITFCRYIVFFDTYDTVLVLYKKKYVVVETHVNTHVDTHVIHVQTTHKKKSHKKKSHKKKTHKGHH